MASSSSDDDFEVLSPCLLSPDPDSIIPGFEKTEITQKLNSIIRLFEDAANTVQESNAILKKKLVNPASFTYVGIPTHVNAGDDSIQFDLQTMQPISDAMFSEDLPTLQGPEQKDAFESAMQDVHEIRRRRSDVGAAGDATDSSPDDEPIFSSFTKNMAKLKRDMHTGKKETEELRKINESLERKIAEMEETVKYSIRPRRGEALQQELDDIRCGLMKLNTGMAECSNLELVELTIQYVERLESEKKSFSQTKDGMDCDLKDLRLKLNQLESRNRHLDKEKLDMEKKNSDLVLEKQTLQSEGNSLREKLQSTDCPTSQDSMVAQGVQLESALEEIEALKRDIEDLTRQIPHRDPEWPVSPDTLTEGEVKLQSALDEIDTLKENILELNEELANEKRSNQRRASSLGKDSSEKIRDMEKQIYSLTKEKDDLEVAKTYMSLEKKKWKKKCSALEKETGKETTDIEGSALLRINDLETSIEGLLNEKVAIQQELEEGKQRMKGLTARMQRITEENNTLKERLSESSQKDVGNVAKSDEKNTSSMILALTLEKEYLEELLDATSKEVAEGKKEIEQAQIHLNELQKELSAKDKAMKNLRTRSAPKRDDENSASKVKALTVEKEHMEELLEKSSAEIDRRAEALSIAENEICELKRKIKDHERTMIDSVQKGASEEEVEEYVNKIKELTSEKEELEDSHVYMSSQLEKQKEDLCVAEKQIEELKLAKSEAKLKSVNMSSQLEKQKEELCVAEKQIEVLKLAKSEAKLKRRQMTDLLNDATEKEQRLVKRIGELEQQFNELQATRQELDGKLNEETAKTERTKRFIETEKEKKNEYKLKCQELEKELHTARADLTRIAESQKETPDRSLCFSKELHDIVMKDRLQLQEDVSKLKKEYAELMEEKEQLEEKERLHQEEWNVVLTQKSDKPTEFQFTQTEEKLCPVEELQRVTGRLEMLEKKCREYEERIDTHVRTDRENQRSFDEMRDKNIELSKDRDELLGDVRKLKRESEDAENELRRKTREQEDLIGNLRQMKDMAEQFREELDRTKTELDRTKTELDRTKTELDRTKTELVRTNTELDRTKDELEEKDHGQKMAVARCRQLENDLNALRKTYNDALEENEKINGYLREVDQQVSRVKQEKGDLEEKQKSTEQDKRKAQKMVEELANKLKKEEEEKERAEQEARRMRFQQKHAQGGQADKPPQRQNPPPKEKTTPPRPKPNQGAQRLNEQGGDQPGWFDHFRGNGTKARNNDRPEIEVVQVGDQPDWWKEFQVRQGAAARPAQQPQRNAQGFGHNDEVPICPVCERKFDTRMDLENHLPECLE